MSDTYIPTLVSDLRQFADESRSIGGCERADELATAAAAEIMRLRERLEIGYAFDGDGKRIASDHEIDGIYCRDSTLKLLDERLREIKAELTRYKRLEAILRNEADADYHEGRQRMNDAMRFLSEWERE